MEDIKRKYYQIVDLSKFIFNKNILNRDVTKILFLKVYNLSIKDLWLGEQC